MTSLRRFALVGGVLLALSACNDSGTEDLPPAVEGDAAAEPAAPPAETPTEQGPPDESQSAEIVIEVEPEVGGTEPMEAALPMADAAPMNDDFGLEDAPAE